MSHGIATADAPTSSRPSRPLAYAQLLRIPNVFTAMADIGLAAVVTAALPAQFSSFILLVLASSCLYCAGMVWNDYFDYQQDLRERPQRPLPSHRITRTSAARLGTVLLGAGVACAFLAGFRTDGFQMYSLVSAVLLAGAILLYDAWLKQTPLGPVGMGLCRFLNVILGLTMAGAGIPAWGFLLALVVGIYIAGVTWFARREALISKQLELSAAALLVLAAFGLALFLPLSGTQLSRGPCDDGPAPPTLGAVGHILFPYLLVGYGFYLAIPAAAAIRNPTPQRVQKTVKRAILGLIVFDAILAAALAGTVGLAILVLLPPAVFLGRWVYST